jgi:uncharacterized protein YjdB
MKTKIVVIVAVAVLGWCVSGCGDKDEKVALTGISVDKQSPLSLEVGDIVQITASPIPENADDVAFKWESANTLIATVTATGQVEAKAVGTTKVTVSSGSIKKVIDIAVQAETIALTAISVDPEGPLELIVGQVEAITATPVPANATGVTFSWTSSHPAVASVSNTGEVEALTEGSATITVASGGIETKVAVTVAEPSYPLTGIDVNVDGNALTLTVGAERQITATPVPGNTTTALNFQWVSENPAIAAVIGDETGGTVTAMAEGSTTITVSQGEVKAEIAVTVNPPALVEVAKPYAAVQLASDATANASSSGDWPGSDFGPINLLWDNVWNPHYPYLGFATFPHTQMPQMFTIDIGAATVLKGIRVHHPAEFEYQQAPHHFKVYGSNSAGMPNDDLNHTDWTLLGTYEFPDPPAGFPLPDGWTHYAAGPPNTHIVNPDIAFASVGVQFSIAVTTPVRYVRFQTLSTYASEGDATRLAWTGSAPSDNNAGLWLGEITLLKASE